MKIFKTKGLWVTGALTFLLLVSFLKSNGENLDNLKLQGQWIYAKDQQIVLFDLPKEIKQIIYTTERTPEIIDYLDLSPDNKTIIFSMDDILYGEKLVLLDKNGSSPKNLTDYEEKVFYRGISWSPDGRKIAVVKGKPGPNSPLFDLYVMSPQGKDARIISDINPELGKPSWSPDSKKIIFAGYGSRTGKTKEDKKISKKGTAAINIGIFMVDIDTRVTSKIIDSGYSPAWSPDGQSIAYYEPAPHSEKAQ